MFGDLICTKQSIENADVVWNYCLSQDLVYDHTVWVMYLRVYRFGVRSMEHRENALSYFYKAKEDILNPWISRYLQGIWNENINDDDKCEIFLEMVWLIKGIEDKIMQVLIKEQYIILLCKQMISMNIPMSGMFGVAVRKVLDDTVIAELIQRAPNRRIAESISQHLKRQKRVIVAKNETQSLI